MMSISAMSSGQENYYLTLAREDYYLEGGEPPGMWHGEGANRLGLDADSQIDKENLRHLFAGFDPETGSAALVQNAGKEDRQPGWDLTFSAPKSVSVLWSQVTEEERLEIQAAQQEATQKAIDYLQEKAAFTRTGKGGTDRERVGLVVGTFEHGTSRAQDPQLHTHALVLNVGVRADGKTATVESHPFYMHARAAGAVYRAELAHQLRGRLGVVTEKREEGWGFEVQGVPKTLMETFSKRRDDIVKKLSELGVRSAKAAEFSALETRYPKEHQARSELFDHWRETGEEHGWSQRKAAAICQGPQKHELTKREMERRIGELCRDVGEKILEQRSTFSERDIVTVAADRASQLGLSSASALAAVESYLKQNPQIKDLGLTQGREGLYTTKDHYELEEKMVAGFHASQEKRVKATLENSKVTKAIEKIEKSQDFSLNDEQRRGVTHITENSAGIACITGMAGAGKTTMLKAAHEAFKREGFTVKGAAIAGKAAEGLQSETGIASSSIAKLLSDLDRSKARFNLREALANFKEYRDKQLAEGNVSWVAKNFNPTLARQWFYENRPNDPFKNCDVLVIDEAAMVDTKQMARLVEETQKRGIKLILVGDDRQLQAIGPGGAFTAAAEILGSEKLTEIHRQKQEWARDAVQDFADRKAKEGLEAYDSHGLVKVSKNRNQARIDLVAAWKKDGHFETPEKSLMLAALREDVKKLNWDAQSVRRRAGELGSSNLQIGDYSIHKKDRVMFTKRLVFKPGHTVENGEFGKVEGLPSSKAGTIRVRLDSGKTVEIPSKNWENLALGYASTTHKAQGSTIDQVYVLAGGQMQDREMSYVQMSRAREHTKIFVDRQHAGKNLAALTQAMQRSRQKGLALSVSKSASTEQHLEPEIPDHRHSAQHESYLSW